MQFLLTIYGDESAWADLSPDDDRKMTEAYVAFGREAADAIVSGEALHPVSTATTVRVRDGERLLTDGPFAETREQLGGFYIVDVAGVDEAIELAARIPGAATGSVEVRPVMVFAPDGQEATA
jgi:hypothetical protein